MKQKNDLKIGYTTGVHAASALKAGLLAYFGVDSNISFVNICLPDAIYYEIPVSNIVRSNDSVYVSVVKSDNDDIDVTKGCKIICKIAKYYSDLSFKKHFVVHNSCKIGKTLQLEIMAGNGVGVVTKAGLKLPVGYPAINPVPLSMMEQVANEISEKFNLKDEKLCVVFEVENGEEIAKNTANQKVGVLGGISFLGQKGIVKPISNEAYLDSLEQEFNVAARNPEGTVVLTMGNTSLTFAEKYYSNLSEECFVEIGNYVYDSLMIIKEKDIRLVSIVANIGKMTKIAQGKKNTNNRFGDIDFSIIKSWLLSRNIINEDDKDIDELITMKAVEEYIQSAYMNNLELFYSLIAKISLSKLLNWAKEIDIKDLKFEVIITDGEKLKAKSES